MIQPEEKQVPLRGEEITPEEKGGRRDRNEAKRCRGETGREEERRELGIDCI